MKIYYDPKLKNLASELREKATYAERLLWKFLRGSQLQGFQFMRQKPIDNFIVDFYCGSLNLVIEIDGISHDGKHDYDKKRENRLKKIGLNVLRLDVFYVIKHIDDALLVISNKIDEIKHTTP